MTIQIVTEPRPQKPATGSFETAASDPPRRLHGKIAALSKEQRDAINKLLHDGSTYGAVINRMADVREAPDPLTHRTKTPAPVEYLRRNAGLNL